MDSIGFVKAVEEKLKPFAPVLISGIIKKQLSAVNSTRETLTPEKTEVFIIKVSDALEMFLGPKGKKKVKIMMLSEFRKYAPEYFEKTSIV
jgi:hypothetical protein